jgi:flagellar basal-body rod protein FlgF
MDRGTYSAASAGLVNLRKLEVVNGNLANINTPGFKREILVGETQSFDQTLASAVAANDPYAKGDHDRTPGVVNLHTTTDFSPGPIKQTDGALDAALRKANDFFVINTPDGQQYTRAGNFTLNSDGALVTADGFTVSGDGGAITSDLPGLHIESSGEVVAPDPQTKLPQIIGKLQVAHIEDPSSLVRVGSSRFKLAPDAASPSIVEPEIEPKSIEMSNVSAITGMIDLISANRAFEMYTKAAHTIDDMNSVSISQIGHRR